MESLNNSKDLNIIVLIVLIIIILLFVFYKRESFDVNELSMSKLKKCMKYKPDNVDIYDYKPTYVTDVRNSNDCPVSKNDKANLEFVKNNLLTSCGLDNPPQTRKEFHNDFFKFRDLTYNNSSIREDAVDRIVDLYLSGNLEQTRLNSNIRIKDLFDCTTAGPNLYSRQCVRLPDFDNINPKGYYLSYGTPGMHLTRDNWNYPNEKISNGGPIRTGLTANDPAQSNQMSLDVFPF